MLIFYPANFYIGEVTKILRGGFPNLYAHVGAAKPVKAEI